MDDASHNHCLLMGVGLEGGVQLLKGIAEKYDDISYADIFQLASAIAVKVCHHSHAYFICKRTPLAVRCEGQ